MDTTELRLAAARHSLDLATGDKLHQAADDLLTRGVYSYSLGELFCVARPTLREVAPLFEAALRELGIPLPPPDIAIRTLVGYHLELITEETGDCRGALRQLFDEVLRPQGWREPPVCPDHDEMGNLFWGYEYLSENVEWGFTARAEGERQLEEMDRELTAFATRWIREYHPCRIDRSWLRWSGGVVRGLAETIAGGAAWDRLPILADALEEAGCTDPHLLEHLRRPGRHKRRCWVVDLLLG